MNEDGSFSMDLIDQTLIIKPVGAWNLETAVRWGDEFKSYVTIIQDKAWACLVDLSKFDLATPDVWEHINDVNQWSNLRNQKYEVVVCNLRIQEKLMENSHKSLWNVETKFFESFDEACLWLKSVGYIDYQVD